MLNDRNGDGLGMLPRPGEPESFLEPGMAAPRMPLRRPARAMGEVWQEGGRVMRQTPLGPVVVVPDPPNLPNWAYDFNPATGNARAQWTGEIAMTGSATLNGSPLTTGAGSVLSFNTRTGAVTLSQADVGAVAPQSFNGRIGAVVPAQGDYPTNLIPGTTTNDNAAAGNIGEFVTAAVASGSSVALGAAGVNVTSISLTAGDWDVSASMIVNNLSGAGTLQTLAVSINTVSGALSTPGLTSYAGAPVNVVASNLNNNTFGVSVGPHRMSLASTTTVFMVGGFGNSGAFTINGYGTIRARRVR